jgi:hypothetical protein
VYPPVQLSYASKNEIKQNKCWKEKLSRGIILSGPEVLMEQWQWKGENERWVDSCVGKKVGLREPGQEAGSWVTCEKWQDHDFWILWWDGHETEHNVTDVVMRGTWRVSQSLLLGSELSWWKEQVTSAGIGEEQPGHSFWGDELCFEVVSIKREEDQWKSVGNSWK